MKSYLRCLSEMCMNLKFVFAKLLVTICAILAFSFHAFAVPTIKSILAMNVGDIEGNPVIQMTLFEDVSMICNEMTAIGRLFQEQMKAKCIVNTKGQDFKELFHQIKVKSERKGYSKIGQVKDMARGRISVYRRKDIYEVIGLIGRLTKEDWHRKDIISPKRELKIGSEKSYGYPRYHMILEHKESGFLFEWQIGNESVDNIFELCSWYLDFVFRNHDEQKWGYGNLNRIVYKGFYEIINKAKKEPEYAELVKQVKLEEYLAELDSNVALIHLEDINEHHPDFRLYLLHLHRGARNILDHIIKLKGEEFLSQPFLFNYSDD